MTLLSIFIAIVFLYSLVSGRLGWTFLTAPIVFMLAGILVTLSMPELGQWKLSPMDIESCRHWGDYTAAYDRMLAAADTEVAPWYIVRADDKRRARLNRIAHLLNVIPYKEAPFEKPDLPKRKKRGGDTPKMPRYKNWVPEIF